MAVNGNRLPVGPGSRGGRWHEIEFRRAYHRAWRAAHPEYRERECLRSARHRDPEAIEPRERGLPEPAVSCVCECGCREPVVVTCGFCREGIHQEEGAA